MGVLAYLGILVLIPLFVAKESRLARFHANQGLTLCLACIAWAIIQSVLIMILGAILLHGSVATWRIYSAFVTIFSFVYIGFGVLAIIGVINAVNGKMKELPLIGKFKLMKD